MNERIVLMVALACTGCAADSEPSGPSVPSIVVEIPSESQAALGYSSIFLSSDGALYLTPTAGTPVGVATYDFSIRAGAPSVTPSALRATSGSSDRAEIGRSASALTGDNPIVRSRIAAVVILALLGDPLAPGIDAMDIIFEADSTTGSANITTNRTSASAPSIVQATATTAVGASPASSTAVSVPREDHSTCFDAMYEGVANAQRFCDCYYGAGTAAALACEPLRRQSETHLVDSARPTAPNGLVSCSAPQPVDAAACPRGYFCCAPHNCWECNGTTAEDENFAMTYCQLSTVTHCP